MNYNASNCEMSMPAFSYSVDFSLFKPILGAQEGLNVQQRGNLKSSNTILRFNYDIISQSFPYPQISISSSRSSADSLFYIIYCQIFDILRFMVIKIFQLVYYLNIGYFYSKVHISHSNLFFAFYYYLFLNFFIGNVETKDIKIGQLIS